MHHATLLARPARLITIGLLGACASLMVQAQSYTSRELKAPLGVREPGCFFRGNNALSDNGDVVGSCAFFEGYYLNDIFPLFPWTYFAYKPVVWRGNGTVQRLSMAARTATRPFGFSLSIDGQGRVLADVSAATAPNGTTLSPGGRLPTAQELGLTLWTGNTRAKWAPPSGFEGHGLVSQASPAGRFVIAKWTSDGVLSLAVTQGNTAQSVPPPPTAKYVNDAVVNDNGQLAVTFAVDDYKYGDYSNLQQWYWNGAAWSPMVLPAIPVNGRWRPIRITANGAVLAASIFGARPAGVPFRALWKAETGAVEVPGDASYNEGYEGDLANNGDLFGQTGGTLDTVFQARATVWRNGQAIDLNTLVKPPAGLVFGSTISVNKRGQILVVAQGTKSGVTPSTWLLTPK